MTKEQYKRLLRTRQSQETMFFILIGELNLQVREVIRISRIPRKRALYILRKWSSNGIYEYGTSIDLGWLKTKYIVHQSV